MDYKNLSIKLITDGLSKKEFSCSELVGNYLENIHKIEPKLNAFITVCDKEGLESANIVDTEISQTGNLQELFNRKPLLGVPFAVKDLYSTLGIKTTAASKVLSDYVPVYDSTSVGKLKAAGAIVIGKTNCDAWAHGASGENSQFGATHNPYDLSKTPGGSSSGSAVAVSADEVPFSLGTDTGGSIRQPASFCNIVGLKPTYGRVSRYGVISMASSLDSIGHFTKTVADSATVLGVTAGNDPKDATSSNYSVDNYLNEIEKGVKGLKIGIPKEYFEGGLDSNIKLLVEKALQTLKSLGAELIEVSLPNTQHALAVYYIIQPSEVSSNLARYTGIRYGNERSEFGDEAKRRIMIGTYTLSSGYYDAYYLKAMKVRTLLCRDFEEVFKKVDVLIAPVSPFMPFNLGEKVENPLAMYLADILTVTANLTGIPALAVPAGFANGLPVGLQIMGPQFSEKLLFQVGHCYEQINHWGLTGPKL